MWIFGVTQIWWDFQFFKVWCINIDDKDLSNSDKIFFFIYIIKDFRLDGPLKSYVIYGATFSGFN